MDVSNMLQSPPPASQNSSSATTPHPQSRPGQQQEYSCVLCKQRKVRCDRANPCSGCRRAGVNCVPGVRQPYKRRKRPHHDGAPGNSALSESPDFLSAPSVPSVSSVPSRPVDTRPLLEEPGQQRQTPAFGQNLWVGLNDEFQDPRSLKSSSEDDVNGSTDDSPFPEPTGLFFSVAPRIATSLRDLHPGGWQAFVLWQTFLNNVNPLTKVIHAPVIQAQVIQASRDFESISRPSVALLFAIYAAAAMSLKEEECQIQLRESRRTLMARYFSACQMALAAASFMKSRNIVVLQAFVIFLLTARQIWDSETFWLLSGMAVRMALRLKHQTDSGSSSDSIYDCQLRRRLWRQIGWIDGRSHHYIGMKPAVYAIRAFPLPANLNDADIHPDMTEMPLLAKGPTEMTFCLCRYEVGEFLLHAKELHEPGVSIQQKDKIIDQFEAYMIDNYLQYLDSAIPLHIMAEGGVRSAICKMRLMVHHPSQYPDKGKSMPQAERDMLFSTAVQMVEYDVVAKMTKTLEIFSWHLDVVFQIDAFVFMLIESRTQAADAPLTQKAWQLVAEVYKCRPALLDEANNELYAATRELTLRAWEAREADIARRKLDPIGAPDVILSLRSRKPRKGKSISSGNLIPPEASALHQLAGVATQVDGRYDDEAGFMNESMAQAPCPFQPELVQQFGGIFNDFNSSSDMPGWAPVDWEFWNDLLDRNVIQ